MVRVTDAPDPLGKRALFWAPGASGEEVVLPGRKDKVTGKHALFSAATEPPPDEEPSEQRAADGFGAGRLVPPVAVHCSSCGVETEVDVLDFAALHVPFFLWRPGRGFTRFMTCPSCRRRCWISASWTPWSAS